MADDLRYVVRRFNWRWAGACFVRAPGDRRVAWYDTPEQADADRDRREAEVRARLNPFRCGPSFHYLSTFPEPVFRDWLLDADVAPPAASGGLAGWARWWDAVKGDLPPAAVARVWGGLDRVRFHDVIARRPSQVAYAVVRLMWDYNDAWYEPGDEGGRATIAYRSRERAEGRRRQLEAEVDPELRGHVTSIDARRLTPDTDWPVRGEHVGTWVDPADVPFYEVVEVDLGEA